MSVGLEHFSSYVGGTGTVSALPQTVAAGQAHACTLLTNGTIECWGANNDGQLGIDSPLIQSSVAVAVANAGGYAHNATAIAAGADNTCAVLSAPGPVVCWGLPLARSTIPVAVANVSNATDLTVGGDHACALLSDGTVSCWGNNESGQLGDGSTNGPDLCADGSQSCSAAAVRVAGLTGRVIAVAAGYRHTCALLDSGSIECWGNDAALQLGQPTGLTCGPLGESCSPVPLPVPGIDSPLFATTIVAGSYFTCAVSSDNVIRCWGNDSSGELGAGQIGFNQEPMGVAAVSGLFNAVGVSASNQNSPLNPSIPSDPNKSGSNSSGDGACALLSDGTVACWGNDQFGQLGAPPAGCNEGDCSDVPVTVGGLMGVTAIAVGGQFACALSSPTIQCWGDNTFGELGNGSTSNTSLGPVQATPMLVSINVTPMSPGVALGSTQQFSASGTFTDSSTRDLTGSLTWNSSAPEVVSISNTLGSVGLGTAVSLGGSTVIATDPTSGIVGTTTATVTSISPCTGLSAGAACGASSGLCGTQTTCDDAGVCFVPTVGDAEVARRQACVDQYIQGLSVSATDPTSGLELQFNNAAVALYTCLGVDTSCIPDPGVPGGAQCVNIPTRQACIEAALEEFLGRVLLCLPFTATGPGAALLALCLASAAGQYLDDVQKCPSICQPGATCVTCPPNNFGLVSAACIFINPGTCPVCLPDPQAPSVLSPGVGQCE